MTEERRRGVRKRVDLPVRLKVGGEVRWAETMMKDISAWGFRCTVYGSAWPVGTRVTFEMPLFLAEAPLTGVSRVIHMSRMAHTDQYSVGLEFSELPPDSQRQLQRFLTRR